jgi:predicted permease
MFILNSIAPIFLLIALGKLLHKTGVFPDAFFTGLNRLVFWIALPSLLISNISSARLEFETISKIVLLLGLGTLLSLAVALAPVVILFNILGVTVLLHYGKKKSNAGASIRIFFSQLIKNPLIAACAIGLALNLFGIQLPLFLSRPLHALGQAALPLILISIGSSLAFERLRGAASPSLIASLVKVVVAPAIGFLFAGLFDLTPSERMVAIFYLAAPAAGMSYVMAEVMGNDATLAGRIVALSTLLSAITLPIIIAIGI